MSDIDVDLRDEVYEIGKRCKLKWSGTKMVSAGLNCKTQDIDPKTVTAMVDD